MMLSDPRLDDEKSSSILSLSDNVEDMMSIVSLKLSVIEVVDGVGLMLAFSFPILAEIIEGGSGIDPHSAAALTSTTIRPAV